MELEVCSAGRGGESGHPWSHASSNPRSAQPGQSASGRQCRQLVTVPTLLPCARHAVGKHRPGPRARRISPGLFFLGFRDPRPSPFPPVLPPPLQLPPFSPPPNPRPGQRQASNLWLPRLGAGARERKSKGLWVHSDSHFKLVDLWILAENTNGTHFL